MAFCVKEDETVALKKDWYQSDTQVIIAIFGKHSSKDDCSVQFGTDEVTVRAKFASGQSYKFNLRLNKNIVPERSTYRLLSSKLEILLAKTNPERWDVLERAAVNIPKTTIGQSRNWDKMVNEMAKDTDDNNIDSVFQRIYSQGSDEVRKAMNKSFIESGGTVLSTNWDEIGRDKVEMKPPEGMEWKKWE